jgi:hypothetical protein
VELDVVIDNDADAAQSVAASTEIYALDETGRKTGPRSSRPTTAILRASNPFSRRNVQRSMDCAWSSCAGRMSGRHYAQR